MMVVFRLLASGLIAFLSYAMWAWYANSLVTNDSEVLLKAALVQGTYSSAITLGFTAFLEYFFKKFGANHYCLPLILPRWSQHDHDNPCATKLVIEHALKTSQQKCQGTCLPGALLSPLPALAIQSILVITINIMFMTPNLWLTILPSIIFSGIYGYAYSFGLSRKLERANVTKV